MLRREKSLGNPKMIEGVRQRLHEPPACFVEVPSFWRLVTRGLRVNRIARPGDPNGLLVYASAFDQTSLEGSFVSASNSDRLQRWRKRLQVFSPILDGQPNGFGQSRCAPEL
jgi:hypothetical protein